LVKLDAIDRAILDALQRDGRLSNTALAAKVGLSESACSRRTHALHRCGAIARYAAVLDLATVGLTGSVFVRIALDRQDQADLDAFETAVRGIPEVMECYLMTGESDYLLRVIVSGAADFERIHRNRLASLPGVARIQSSFAIRRVKEAEVLPLVRDEPSSHR
jgi:DNA-binding Lrp family transcriptional regulator